MFRLLPFILCCLSFQSLAQQQDYKVGCIGFYNLENLFDTEDDPAIRDDDFTPNGDLRWTEDLYREKLDRLAEVVGQIGTDLTPDGLSILGVAEIENRRVLEDFADHPGLRNRNYQVLHFDSPDKRGIDVALLYQPKYFQPTFSKNIPMTTVKEDGDTLFTRDILWVSGYYDGDLIHVLVNHWPSRRGGERRSAPYRNLAALQNKRIVDSLQAADPTAKVIIMGDLNDDPTSPSVKDVLNAKYKKNRVPKKGLYNPMYAFYKKGLGTTAWRGAWSLFDQIILSSGLLNKDTKGYQYYKASVFNKKFLIQKTGSFKGYPWRTFAGGQYLKGYSDHFPVYLYLIKAI
ncbi:MAG: endonuclease/exonuclease/phosphatase family protein [Bacteroidota bacterium]